MACRVFILHVREAWQIIGWDPTTVSYFVLFARPLNPLTSPTTPHLTLGSADCCCAGKVVSSALSSLSSRLDSLILLLLFFAGRDPSWQLATSFLPAQSFCTQKWSQASNESQTLPSDPPRLYSSFSSVSSSSKTLALPCGTERTERKRRATSEAVGRVVASTQVAFLP